MAIIVFLLVFTHLGQDLLNHEGTLLLGVFLFPIYTPLRINLLGAFLVLFGIYIACFVVAAKSNGGFIHSLRDFLNGSAKREPPNWLTIMPLAGSALLLLVVALTVVQDAVGVSSGGLPTLKPYQYLYTLAYASPLEETMFRISTLGLIVALRVFWSRPVTALGNGSSSNERLVLLSFFVPEKAKEEAGLPTLKSNGWRAFSSTEWLALIVTSAGFGLAHLLSGVGWEVGKVTTATLSGLALGLAYLAYGAYASILLHWFFDLYLGTFSVGQMVLPGVFDTASALIVLLLIAVGIVGIIAGITQLIPRRPAPGETPYMVPGPPPPA